MKKIMFNTRYGLEQAVIDRIKTKTRRIIKFSPLDAQYLYDKQYPIDGRVEAALIDKYSRFRVGEIVAVAQSYKNAGYDPQMLQRAGCAENGDIGDYPICELSGWNNKMFTYPTMMPHQIRFTNVQIERLQEISDKDCIAEGIKDYGQPVNSRYGFEDDKRGDILHFASPREDYAALINKISGKGTWESNPYVFAYDFELVK